MSSEALFPKTIVMIVDDTPGNLALLSDTLSESGYRVLVATDGESALEQIAFQKPDIILLDVIMPGIDGFETCKRLKANPGTAAIPVIFMTALGELEDLLQAFEEGAVDYLVKPIRPPEVLVRIETQLKQLRMLQRVEHALNNSPFTALSYNASGNITWLPETAARWLGDFLSEQGLSETLSVGAPLPAVLLTCLEQPLNPSKNADQPVIDLIKGNVHLTAKCSTCQVSGETLILLEKQSGQWNLDAIKTSLGLTVREAEILMWISRGKTNKEIGLILGNSPRTINKHLEHSFEKLGVFTRAAAVAKVINHT